MPERDTDLVQLFVRDLDQIELPPRDRWRPAPRRESVLMRSGRSILYAGAVAAVLVAALIGGFALRDRNEVAATPSPIPATSTPSASPLATVASVPTSAPASPATATPPPPQRSGTIRGALGYPSNFIPPLTIYAISVADPRVFFSVETPRLGGDPMSPPASAAPGATPAPPSYTLTGIAPGTYYVIGYRNDDVNTEAKNSPVVYSQYTVSCIQATQASPAGPNATPAPGCTFPGDHSLIPVTVNVGPAVTGIDLKDWPSPQQGTYPPRPR